ncbi:MAG: LysE family transporter [Blautia sp.]
MNRQEWRGRNRWAFFLLQHESVMNMIGSCLILGIGISMFTKINAGSQDMPDNAGGFRMFAAFFAVGITNPAAILTFLFAFSWFGIDGRIEPADGIGLVCGVFIGTYIWWGTLSGVVTLLKKKAGNSHLSAMNRIFGTILIFFGAVVLVRSFLH